MSPYWPGDGWASHDANGKPLGYPGPDGKTLYFEGYPWGWHEVHEHRNLKTSKTVTHSHDNDHMAHKGYGMATFTVCARGWMRSTGLKGGGNKVFTKEPTGPQL